jgi:hypothetical protein
MAIYVVTYSYVSHFGKGKRISAMMTVRAENADAARRKIAALLDSYGFIAPAVDSVRKTEK